MICGAWGWFASSLEGATATEEREDEGDDEKDEEDMDPDADGLTEPEEADCPKDEENYGDCPKHGVTPMRPAIFSAVGFAAWPMAFKP